VTTARRILALAIVVAAAAALFLTKTARKMPDFAVYHRAGARVVHAEPLYRASDGHFQFKYPPFAGVLFAPLGRLPLPAAKALWFAVVVLALLGSLVLSRRLVPEARHGPWLIGLTLLVEAKFFGHELTLGQVNAVLLLLMLLALHALRARRDVAAGLLLALVISVKPYALVFLPFFAVKRRWGALGGALLGLLVASAAPCLRYGWAPTLDLYRSWYDTLSVSTPALLTSQDNVSLFGFFAKRLGPEHPALPWAVLTVALALVVLLAWAIRARGRSTRSALALETSMLLILMPLCSPLGWDYVFLWSTPGVMLLLASWPGLSSPVRALLAVALVLVGGTLFDVMGRELYGVFMDWSLLTLAFVALIGLLARVRVQSGAVGVEAASAG